MRAERPLGGEAKLENVQPGATVEIVLQALGSLSGVAVDAAGQPVPQFDLAIATHRPVSNAPNS